MTCREAVESDDYKGFGVAFRGAEGELPGLFGNAACLRRVSDSLAFVYYDYPQELLGGLEYPFGTMQKCYGLLSEQELSASGVFFLREEAAGGLYGSSTLIGFVDTGINFAEDAFRYTDGSTRLLALWDQGLPGEGDGEEAFYGTVFPAEQLNAALQTERPYEAAGSRDENGHGSALARTAAGSPERGGGEPDYGGVAPLARLAVVKLKQAKPHLRRYYRIPEGAECYAEEDIIYGIEWLLATARRARLPLVLCIALGSSQGNHTGATVLSRYLNDIAGIPGICVVTAGGNEGGLGHHYAGTVEQGKYEDVELIIGEGEKGFCTELWAEEPNVFTIEITTPGGEIIPRIPGRGSYSRRYPLFFEGGSVEIQSNLYAPFVGVQGIWIRFSDMAEGIWRIRVFSEGDFAGRFQMWLPVAPFLESDTRFLNPDPYTLICDPGAAGEVLTLTAYDTVSGALYQNASFGYTADNRIKPELAGPQGRNGFTGTGMAAAFTAGGTALVFEAVQSRTGYALVNTSVIRRLYISTAGRERAVYPNREWGYGRLDLYRAFVRSPGRQ